MSRSLMGREVPDEMFNMANGVFARGGKAFVCLPEGGGLGNCSNCEGAGQLILQRVTGGPFDSPPRGTITSIKGQWYQVDNKPYTCPVCLGGGSVSRQAKKPAQEILF